MALSGSWLMLCMVVFGAALCSAVDPVPEPMKLTERRAGKIIDLMDQESTGRGGEDDEDVDGNSVAQLTERQVSKILELMDRNNDGIVDGAEASAMRLRMNSVAANKDATELLGQLDANEDGKVSDEELLGGIEAANPDEPADEIAVHIEIQMAKFIAADENGDGSLNITELAGFARPETTEEVLRAVTLHRMKEKDKDHDGELSLEEFWAGEDDTRGVGVQDYKDFIELDKNNNTKLSLDEVLMWESGFFQYHQSFLIATREFFKPSSEAAMELEVNLPRSAAAQLVAALPGSDLEYHWAEWAEHLDHMEL